MTIKRQTAAKALSMAIDMLSNTQRELFLTLCAMLKYSDDVYFVTGKEGKFSRSSVDFYLPSLSHHLESLIDMELVSENDGQIFVDRKKLELVLQNCDITLDSCKSFKAFCDEKTRLDAQSHDLSEGLTRGVLLSLPSLLHWREFSAVYRYFSSTDSECEAKAYCIVAANSLMKNSPEHCRQNNVFYIKLLSKASNLHVFDTDAIWQNTSSDALKGIFLLRAQCHEISANLENKSYEQDELYTLLLSTLRCLYRNIYEIEDSSVKSSVLDEVFFITGDIFRFFKSICGDGKYIGSLDRPWIKQNDINPFCCLNEGALSIPFAESTLTVELYGIYQKLVDFWLVTNKSLRGSDEYREMKSIFEDISFCFIRTMTGYDRFRDILSKRHGKIKIWNALESCRNGKLQTAIDKNKRFTELCDSGKSDDDSESRAKEFYAMLTSSRRPMRYLLYLLDYDFPITNGEYKVFDKLGISEFCATSEKIAKFPRKDLLLYLIEEHRKYSKKTNLTNLYEKLITRLFEAIIFPASLETHIIPAINQMYVLEKLSCLGHGEQYGAKGDFADMLYEKYVYGKSNSHQNEDSVIARALFDYFKLGKHPENTSSLHDALNKLIFGYTLSGMCYDRKGFEKFKEIIA